MTTCVPGSSVRTRLVSVYAVDGRKPDVDDRDVGALARDRVPAGGAVGGFRDDVERRFERGAQTGARQRVIFDDDDPGPRVALHHSSIAGSVIVKVLPAGDRGAYCALPPCFSAIRRTM